MKPVWRQRLPLLAILLAGTALRFFQLGAGSLWYDETVSVFLAGSPVPELLRHTAGDIHPPGYYLLLRGWLLLAGYPTGHAAAHGQGLEFTSAYLSLFCGILLIALAYAFARRLAGRRTGLLAAGLVALSPYNVWYSQEVRMYTLGAALGLLVLLALWQATQAGRAAAWRWWLLYALAAAAGMYTLYYFAFLLLPANLWALARLLPRRRLERADVDRRDLGREGATTFGREGATTLDHEDAKASKSTKREGLAARRVGAHAKATAQEPTQRAAHSTTDQEASPAHAGTLRVRHPLTVSPPHRVTLSPCHPLTGSPSRLRAPKRAPLLAFLLANLAAVALYAPWLPVAWRQATQPPVPPWRTIAAAGVALRESWTALVAGQSAPAWLWPATLLLVPVYLLGLLALASSRGPDRQSSGAGAALLCLATFGSLALILLASTVTPLYHVRYVFTYSPAFYIVLAAGLAWLGRRARLALPVLAALWLVAAGLALRGFWYDPQYRPDDHRAAVAFLQAHWRPGDVVLVNAGYAYTALATYWQPELPGRDRQVTPAAGWLQDPAAWCGRLTGPLPPGGDRSANLIALTTGHVDGGPGLGWDDPRSDFFAMPAAAARDQVQQLFARFGRVWQYRIYDTVNDPQGELRATLAQDGQLFADQVFAGEAFMRVQGYVARTGEEPGQAPGQAPDPAWPRATAGSLTLAAEPLPGQAAGGETIYPTVWWQPAGPPAAALATSLRLVAADGAVWAQPPDEHPLGPQFEAQQWPAGAWQHQPLALAIPPGTPPGAYDVELVAYDPASGRPWPVQSAAGRTAAGLSLTGNGIRLGRLAVVRPQPEPALQPAPAAFGPLALLAATTPAAGVRPGDQVPLDLTWQAVSAPGQPLVVVVQLLDGQGQVAAGLEEQPLGGRYPTQAWEAHEEVRDRHVLDLPAGLAPGAYRLVVGLYRAADRGRLQTRRGPFGAASPFGAADYYEVKTLQVGP